MKKKLIWFLPVLAILFAFSCEENNEKILLDSEERIIGTWIWLESVYYYTPSGVPFYINPDTLGYSIRYAFNDDGSFQQFRNAIPESEGTYWFETILYENGSESPLRLFTRENDYLKSVNFAFSGDTLIIDETEVDGARRYFIREDISDNASD
jgi:hypothetical protein